ncbi:hypothetical protein K466DRAFT_582843 [Polyporus arcularius HHB13444]|uniref:Uncharacterized protein n=1 Tax=Polyporus arcularius HHB13444 TaxID=1314778 RepID=A0A5C3PQG5_9APHY|nr:hypothetical protein K466DRAFT_582843 [Polyporus arcularius HHB13444]
MADPEKPNQAPSVNQRTSTRGGERQRKKEGYRERKTDGGGRERDGEKRGRERN